MVKFSKFRYWIAILIAVAAGRHSHSQDVVFDTVPGQRNPMDVAPQQPRFRPFYTSSYLSRISNAPFTIGGLWMTDSQMGLTEARTSFKFPILKIFGSPPPIVKVGFDYTNLYAADEFGLPGDLYQYTIGVSTVRKINEQWVLRSMLGIALATDNENRSSDAWQFRGGIFGIKQVNDVWQFSLGAIALGRDDIPVVPAIGAVWTPNPAVRCDLILPNPKINFLMFDDCRRQQWLYLGGGFNGTTWGYESQTLGDDRLTYGDLRLVAGWKSTPSADPSQPFVRGRKFNLEIGYSFNRDFEFDDEQTKIDLDNAFLFGIETSY